MCAGRCREPRRKGTRVAAPSGCIVPWAARASCWPQPQQLLPVSAAGSGRRCCTGAFPRRTIRRVDAVRIHPCSPFFKAGKTETPVSNGYRSFCFTCLEKGAARVDSNSCGAVAEDSAKTAQWAVFSSAARAIHTRPPRTPVSEPGTGVSVLSALKRGCKGGFEQHRPAE